MKDIALIILTGLALGLLLLLFEPEDNTSILREEKVSPQSGIGYCVIDSCEYITWGQGLAHKGNCKFCAERRKKEAKQQ